MKTKGFTLVELLVVIAILAILATVSVVGYTSFIENANNSAAQQELIQVRDKVIADDILNGDVTVDGYIKMTVDKDATVTDADKAEAEVLAYLNELKDGLEGTITITADVTENKGTDGTTVVSYTVTVSEVEYQKDSGKATWTLSTGKVE